MPKVYEHQDRLGRSVGVGDCVAVPHHNGLMIATVKSISPKMIQIVEVGKDNSHRPRFHYNKYPSEAVKLDGPEVTMYLLRFGAG